MTSISTISVSINSSIMCNTKPSSPPSFLSPNKTLLGSTDVEEEDEEQLLRWPTPSEALEEMKEIGKISGATAITGLVMYSRAMISMMFLGWLGEVELAGGSLSIGVANITGYSVISGLALGMEPICGQAHGAGRSATTTLHRTVLLLLTASVPIAAAWANMKPILVRWCRQDEAVSAVAHTFILFSIPDLLFLSLLHPIRIHLRAQGVTFPVTCCSAASVLLHAPINFLLVVRLRMGVAGVALSAVLTNANLFLLLLAFLLLSRRWVGPTRECLRGWAPLLSLAVPTCVSVCLEWWWYELIILLCGLLPDNPTAAVASMGVLIQTTSLLYVFPSSLALAASVRVSNALGARRPARARAAAAISLAAALAIGLAAALFAFSVRHNWARLFARDPHVLRLTATALPILALCELGNCPQTAACGVLRGTARPAIAANINLTSFYLLGMPISLAMAFFFRLGFPGLWLGLLAAQASCALLMLYAVCTTDWLAQARRATILTASAPTVLSCDKDEDDLQEIVVKPSSDTQPLITTTKTH